MGVTVLILHKGKVKPKEKNPSELSDANPDVPILTLVLLVLHPWKNLTRFLAVGQKRQLEVWGAVTLPPTSLNFPVPHWSLSLC